MVITAGTHMGVVLVTGSILGHLRAISWEAIRYYMADL